MNAVQLVIGDNVITREAGKLDVYVHRHPVGYVGWHVELNDPLIAWVTWEIGNEQVRQGFGARAVTALVNHLRDTYGYRLVALSLAPESSAGLAFAEALDFEVSHLTAGAVILTRETGLAVPAAN